MNKRVFLFLGMWLACAIDISAAGKIQVWDFGAEALDETVYQNMLSADEINGWYPDGTVAGTSGVTLPAAFTASEGVNLRWEGNGKSNHRLRSVNTALTRYDDKSLTGADGHTYTGYVYSNSASTPDVYLASQYSPDDRIEVWVGSNGGSAQYRLLAPDGKEQFGYYTAQSKLEKLTFYAGTAGEYRLACLTEKLVVARILRYPAQVVTVSGRVTSPAGLPAETKLQFTNSRTGTVTSADIVNGAYSVALAAGYDYVVGLENADAFVVENKELAIAYEQESAAFDLNIIEVDLVTLTGAVTGLDEAALGKVAFELEKPAGKVFQPEVVMEGAAYTLVLERGVEYAVRALHVNDYRLGIDKISATADGSQDLAFTLKPLHNITIAPTGATVADLATAVFTFDNLKEEGYSYAFTGTEGIRLRDGVYSVKVGNSGIFTQLLTSNLHVDGADVEKTVDFTSDVTTWTFNAGSFIEGGYANTAETYNYQGLTFTGGKSHNNTYLYMGAGSVTVPVKGACRIDLKVCYQYKFNFPGGETVDMKTGSTSQIDTYSYTYTGTAGEVAITFGGTSYVNAIEIVETAVYQPLIEVGADKACTTINDALALIRKMERDASTQPVTVSIAPGNYEEMLVVDRDNVRLVNASATPSIALKNKGVDIDENAVRITSYYGHGYNYASMGADFKWDARTLQVNKENGYPSTVNGGGSGTTYWNATVVVEGKDFYAENIIFENSYNQYVSAKEAADLVVETDGGKGARPTEAGNTDVQRRTFRERAAALAVTQASDRTLLNNCRVVGRQDSFYGAACRVACYKGVLMGACDYLFGGMNLTCYDTELALLTDEDKNDVAYITAPQTAAGQRGMLFYACRVTSAQPGVDMNEGQPSKPGLWGRPWAGKTSEAVFAGCRIEACAYDGEAGNHTGKSLIAPAGWDAGLSSASERCGEWGCNDNTAQRVDWAVRFTEPNTSDGVAFTLSNWTKGTDGWNPFAAYDVDTEALPQSLPCDFPSSSSSVASPKTPDAGIGIFSRGKEVFVTNVVMPTDVRIYGMDGRLVSACRVEENVRMGLPEGFYVLHADNDRGKTAGKVTIR